MQGFNNDTAYVVQYLSALSLIFVIVPSFSTSVFCQLVCLKGLFWGLYYTPYIHLLSVILWRVIISITHHLYADDSQVYLAFKINDASSIKNRIESCVGNICRWMNHNDLRERTYNWSCARLFEISWWPFAGLREHWKWKDLLIW